MKRSVSFILVIELILLLFLCPYEILCRGFSITEKQGEESDEKAQPVLPLLAPSPSLMPFRNFSVPRLSGRCKLNFTAAESLMTTTATDCAADFALYLANAMCCPQLHATLTILMGLHSTFSRTLTLNETHAENCLSDIQQILEGQGADQNVQKICSIYLSKLTASSCPIIDLNEFENTVNTDQILAACQSFDPVTGCCSKFCTNAILEATEKISRKKYGNSSAVDDKGFVDCKNVVLYWLASRVDPPDANRILRGLYSCEINQVCPLNFPQLTNISKECANSEENHTACCDALQVYMSHLQDQSLITNLQALNCATMLGFKLQESNISRDLYSLCHINLNDFSLQGCLLQSSPSDAIYDMSSGVSFFCDINRKINSPWPSSSVVPDFSCHKSVRLPELPKATSAQSGLHVGDYFILGGIWLLYTLCCSDSCRI